MRILFLSTDFKPRSGGVAELSYQVCSELGARGHDVCVLTQPAAGQPAEAVVGTFRVLRQLRDFSAARTPWRRIAENEYWGWHTARVIRRQLAHWSPDVVFAGNGHRAWNGILPGCGRPYFLFLHGEDAAATLATRYPWRRGGFARLLRRAAGTFWNSSYSASLGKQLCGKPLTSAVVVGCGYPAEQINPAPDVAGARQRLGWPDAPVLLTVARLVLRKGIDTTLRALPLIRATYPTARYAIIGEGPAQPELERITDELGLRACVQFMGFVPEAVKRDAYTASSLYVMPSRPGEQGEVEGFGISFLEANALGLAVVGSRAGGIPDAVADGETGVLVAPDDPADLARAVVELLGQPERCRAMARAGQERIRTRFNWRSIVDQIESRLTAAVTPRSGGGAQP